MARTIGSEGRYARQIFPDKPSHLACRKIRRAGGSAKLSLLSVESRALLLGVPSEALGLAAPPMWEPMTFLRIEEVPEPVPTLRNHKLHPSTKR